MVLRAGVNGCGKSRPLPGFEPQTVHPVASRYPGPQCKVIIGTINNCRNNNNNNNNNKRMCKCGHTQLFEEQRI